MKRPSSSRRPPRKAARRPAGKPAAPKPTPGWKPRNQKPGGWSNPRPPSVPSTMDLRLNEYYAGAALIGVLSSQGEEPDLRWIRKWTWQLADEMCADALRRRRRKQ